MFSIVNIQCSTSPMSTSCWFWILEQHQIIEIRLVQLVLLITAHFSLISQWSQGGDSMRVGWVGASPQIPLNSASRVCGFPGAGPQPSREIRPKITPQQLAVSWPRALIWASPTTPGTPRTPQVAPCQRKNRTWAPQKTTWMSKLMKISFCIHNV